MNITIIGLLFILTIGLLMPKAEVVTNQTTTETVKECAKSTCSKRCMNGSYYCYYHQHKHKTSIKKESTNVKSTKGINNFLYDAGYESVYFDEDYSEVLYDTYSDYAIGVDDDLEEEEDY